MKQKLNLEKNFFNKEAFRYSFQMLKKNVMQWPGRNRAEGPITTFSIHDLENYFTPMTTVLFKAIRNGTYRPAPSKKSIVFADKSREITKFEWWDALVQHHFARVLNEAIADLHSDSLYSYRKNRSHFMALHKIAAFITKTGNNIFVFKGDVQSYGESFDHGILLADFSSRFESETLKNLLFVIAKYEYFDNFKLISNQIGLPTGSPLQNIFANLYLDVLDRRLDKVPDSVYVRFGDDLLFMTSSRSVFREACSTIKDTLTQRKLVLKPEKHKELILCKSPQRASAFSNDFPCHDHFEHLGHIVWADAKIDLPSRKLEEVRSFIRKHLKSLDQILNQNSYSPERRIAILCEALMSLYSSRFFEPNPLRAMLLSVTDERRLKELDRWTCLLILSLAYGKFRKGNFKKFNFFHFRKSGFHTLSHLRKIRAIPVFNTNP